MMVVMASKGQHQHDQKHRHRASTRSNGLATLAAGVFVVLCVVLCSPLAGNHNAIISANAQVVLEELEDFPAVAIRKEPFTFRATFSYDAGKINYTENTRIYYRVYREETALVASGNFSATQNEFKALDIMQTFTVTESRTGYHSYTLMMDVHPSFLNATSQSAKVHVINGGLTLLPPLFTIGIVILTKNVLLSLYTGVFVAAFLIYRFNPILAFCRTFDTILLEAFSDPGHVEVILFTWFLSGMVACILKTGGGEGLAKSFSSWATTPRAGCLVTVILGLFIFFDGIANTLIVGQTVRPITDLLGISREKLAFLVDATSSPVTSISPISTWVGFELSLIDNALRMLGDEAQCYDSSAFIIFVKTIPGQFYPFLMICLQLYLIFSGREYGPMLSAERKARRNLSDNLNVGGVEDEEYKDFEPDPETPKRWWNAGVPVIMTTVIVIISLVVTGVDGARKDGVKLSGREIFGHSDSYAALLYGSVAGTLSIWVLAVMQRIDPLTNEIAWISPRTIKFRPLMSWSQSLDTWILGIKSLTIAVLILLLAWSVGEAFTLCGTATFISRSLSDSIEPGSYPAVTFLISAFLAVVTGSSWGTMGIVFPLIIPAAHHAAPCNRSIFYSTIASVLSGAVFGDHCSPISDTTILSSISCRCNLSNHVKTQLPYALLAGLVGVMMGYLPAGFNAYPSWVGLLLGIAIILILCHVLSTPVDGEATDLVTKTSAFVYRKIFRKRATTAAVKQSDADAAGLVVDANQSNCNGSKDTNTPLVSGALRGGTRNNVHVMYTSDEHSPHNSSRGSPTSASTVSTANTASAPSTGTRTISFTNEAFDFEESDT